MNRTVEKYLISKTGKYEITIVQMLSDDNRANEIASVLKKSPRTIEGKILRIKQRFECKTVGGLVALFFRNNLIK